MTKQPLSALEKAMRLLSMRACSEAELNLRLRHAGYSQVETDAALKECLRRHYIDDEQLADDCASLWHGRGHGLKSIRCKLKQRGVPAEIAAAVLDKSAGTEPEAALRALESRLPSLLRETDRRKRRAKALRFLVSRGFSGASIRVAMDHLAEVAAGQEVS